MDGGSGQGGGMVRVRAFGFLQPALRQRTGGGPAEAEVPAGGLAARDLAEHLGLPVERIEGVFCNHTIRPLTHVVMPGDEVAFVPHGTPGPHRFFLGLYDAGQGKDRHE